MFQSFKKKNFFFTRGRPYNFFYPWKFVFVFFWCFFFTVERGTFYEKTQHIFDSLSQETATVLPLIYMSEFYTLNKYLLKQLDGCIVNYSYSFGRSLVCDLRGLPVGALQSGVIGPHNPSGIQDGAILQKIENHVFGL